MKFAGHKYLIFLMSLMGLLFILLPVKANDSALSQGIEKLKKEDVSHEFGNEVLKGRLFYFRDTSKKLQIDEVLNSSSLEWNPVQPQWLNFGIMTDPMWVKIDLPSYSHAKERMLEIANHNIDNISFYLVESHSGSESLIEYKDVGSYLPIEKRQVSSRYYLFPFTIPPQTKMTVYLKVDTEVPMRLPINLWDQESLSKNSDVRSIIQGAYLGLVIVMGLYNLCIALFTRDSSYYYYSLMILSLLGFVSVDNGMALNYLWPDNPGIDFQAAIIFAILCCASSIPFTISFLSLKQNAPGYVTWFKFLLGVWGIILVGAIIYPSVPITYASLIVALPGSMSLILVGIHTWRKGVPAAKFYTIAWLVFIMCTGVYDFMMLGIYPMNTFTQYSLMGGSFMEITLLSLGLAWRIRSLDDAKQKADYLTKAKSEFLAAMSHEIRTPMNGILGMAEIMRDTKLSDQQTTYLNTILGSGRTLLTVLNDILDYSKIEAGKIELEDIQFNIRSLIDETTSVFAVRAVEKNLYFNVYISADVPALIAGDPTRVSQVINNFISNAFKFTNKGSVLIRVEKTEDNRLLVKVKDSGIGIPSDKLGAVFENFTQVETSTARKYGGTGLGLPISKKFIEMMGGEIGVDSIPKEGSTFWFSIPIERDVPFAPLENYNEIKRILIISPDNVFKEQFEAYQQRWGIQCRAYNAITNCLTALDKEEIHFNYIVIDQYCSDYSESLVLSGLLTKPWAHHSKLIFLLKIGSSRIVLDKSMAPPIYEEYPVSVTRLQLLISNAASTSQEASLDAGGSGIYKDMHILVADDNQVNKMVVAGYLKRLGISPILKSNGKEVFEEVCHSAKEFDLILMDCEMPEMDGFEATRRIRQWEEEHKKENAVNICALSAHVMGEYRQKCFDAGMNEYLSKPIVYDDLCALLEKFHNNQISAKTASK